MPRINTMEKSENISVDEYNGNGENKKMKIRMHERFKMCYNIIKK